MRSWLAAALALVGTTSDAQPAVGPFGSVAGGEFTTSLSPGVEKISVQVGPTPVGCEIAADHKTAACDIPATLGPGLWPVEIEALIGGERAFTREIIELRVPAIVSAEPSFAAPGATIELQLEAPIPDDEPVELLILGEDFGRVVEPRLVRPSRLRVRLPKLELPQQPALVIRVRDMQSEPFHGLVVNRWFALARSWFRLLVPGVAVAAGVALVVIIASPKPGKAR
jgi:hypothetical protein